MYYKRIKDTREDKDMTQKQVAKYLNITQQSYYRYESGAIEIPLHLIIKLSKLWNVSIDYLVENYN